MKNALLAAPPFGGRSPRVLHRTAEGGTRTPTPSRAHAPKACASAIPPLPRGVAVLDCGTWAILPRMSEPRAGASGDDGRRVVVVGGGPAGLTAAWALMKAGVRAVVLEKDTQFG